MTDTAPGYEVRITQRVGERPTGEVRCLVPRPAKCAHVIAGADAFYCRECAALTCADCPCFCVTLDDFCLWHEAVPVEPLEDPEQAVRHVVSRWIAHAGVEHADELAATMRPDLPEVAPLD